MASATEREDEYRRQVEAYLLNIKLAKNWNQSDMARLVGLTASAINKAFSRRHSLGFDVLVGLETKSGIPIPAALKNAAQLRRQRADQARVDEVIKSSPELRRLLQLGVELKGETDPERQKAIREEMGQLIRKVA